jgi:hypothetical protein
MSFQLNKNIHHGYNPCPQFRVNEEFIKLYDNEPIQ